MIGKLKGTIDAYGEDHVVLDVHGVGYLVHCSARTLQALPGVGEAATLSNMKNPMKGCGPFVHDDPVDRPPEIFGGEVSLQFDPQRPPYVLLPIIPAQ